MGRTNFAIFSNEVDIKKGGRWYQDGTKVPVPGQAGCRVVRALDGATILVPGCHAGQKSLLLLLLETGPGQNHSLSYAISRAGTSYIDGQQMES